MIHGRPETMTAMTAGFDASGDSYRRDVTAAGLGELVKMASDRPSKSARLTETEREIRESLASSDSGLLFAACSVYVDAYSSLGGVEKDEETELALVEAKLRIAGAKMSQADPTLADVSHVILDPRLELSLLHILCFIYLPLLPF